MIKVRIPATTANMGPGFDSLGMALKLYNEISVEEKIGKTVIINEGIESKEDFRENLIYKSMIKVLNRFSYIYDGFIINVESCNIPICRGLGSSAACIVGGVAAASAIMGNKLSMNEIIEIATEIEGHPDNIVPAAVGGMVVSMQNGNEVSYSRVNIPKELRFVAMVPEFKVSTAMSRGVLPKAYIKEDCIFNISRSAMLISAFNNGELNILRQCFDDKIHQPYRKNLIKNAEPIFEKVKEMGAVGEFISGSGSTLMAVINKNEKQFEEDLKEFLSKFEDKWNVFLLEPDMQGVLIV